MGEAPITIPAADPDTFDDFAAPDIIEKAKEVVKNLVPQRSKLKYESAYVKFNRWRTAKKIKSFSEATLLAYFHELSIDHKPTSLWATYSMLRSMIQIKHRLNIYSYSSLIAFLKQKNKGYKSKKSKVLSAEHINTFLEEAPDNKFLAIKVALIFGVLGACRRHELCNLTVNDIEDKLDMLLVRLPITKTDRPRLFVVTDDFYQIYKKYAILRPKHVSTTRFFLNYRDGRCSQQVIGINSFGSMPKLVAVFLKLQDPKSYTGHTFRRTSATLLADSSAELLTRKKHDGWRWKPNKFSEDEAYMGQQIAHSISRKSTLLEKSYQTDLNNKITALSRFDNRVEDGINFKIDNLNTVSYQTDLNEQIGSLSPVNIRIKDEKDLNTKCLLDPASHQTESNERMITRSPVNVRIKEEDHYDNENLNSLPHQTDPITTQSPINIYIGDKKNFQVDGLNALSSSCPKNIHFHFSNCPNISIYINKEKCD